MNRETLDAAKAFLRDACERELKHKPSDDELTEWALLQWARIRSIAPKGTKPSQLLDRLAPSSEFPGLGDA